MLEYREALELFRYNYETGVLYWRWRVNNRVPKTLEAGTQNKLNGYLYVTVHGRRYRGVFLESREKVYSPNRGKPETYIPRNIRYVRRSRRRTGGSQFKI